MKRSVLLSILLGSLIISSNSEASDIQRLDTSIIPHISDAYSYNDDGYAEVVKTLNGTIIRASSKDHIIKQITHTSRGEAVDGAICGEFFDTNNMKFKLLHEWSRDDMIYRTYEAPDEHILVVAVRKNTGEVARLEEYSKTIANC